MHLLDVAKFHQFCYGLLNKGCFPWSKSGIFASNGACIARVYFAFIVFDRDCNALLAEHEPGLFDDRCKNRLMQRCKVSDVKFSMQDISMLIFIIFFAKVWVNVPDSRCIMHTFVDQTTCLYFWKHRLPVLVWVRKSPVVKQWALISQVFLIIPLLCLRFGGNTDRCLRRGAYDCRWGYISTQYHAIVEKSDINSLLDGFMVGFLLIH